MKTLFGHCTGFKGDRHYFVFISKFVTFWGKIEAPLTPALAPGASIRGNTVNHILTTASEWREHVSLCYGYMYIMGHHVYNKCVCMNENFRVGIIL